jgi:hypothetical protein
MSPAVTRPRLSLLLLTLAVDMIALLIAGAVGVGTDLCFALLTTSLQWHSPALLDADMGYFLGLGLPGAIPFGLIILFFQSGVIPFYVPPDRGLSWAGATVAGAAAYWLIGWALFTFPPLGPAIRGIVDWGRATDPGDSASNRQLILYLVDSCGLGILLAAMSAALLCVFQWLALCTDRSRAWLWSLTTFAASVGVGGFALPLWIMLAWSGGL